MSESVPYADCGRPVVRVDVVVFTLQDGDLQVLLVQRPRPPHERKWGVPGKVVGPDERLEAAAMRILQETTGLTEVYLEQLYTYGEPEGDPRDRVIAVSYLAVVPGSHVVAGSPDAKATTRWWPTRALPPLAFDYARILNYALTRLRYKLEYTAVGFELLPEEFTLTELQTAYEIVLGEELDKRNFRRKILSAGVIEASGRYRAGEGRPAKLYRYRDDAVAEVKTRRLFP
jgi:8-oxo-dGTP diphosphatase